jgi:hypothetical protein
VAAGAEPVALASPAGADWIWKAETVASLAVPEPWATPALALTNPEAEPVADQAAPVPAADAPKVATESIG